MFWLVLVSNPPAFAVVEKITIANAVQISFVLFILKKLKILDAKVLILFYISTKFIVILSLVNIWKPKNRTNRAFCAVFGP